MSDPNMVCNGHKESNVEKCAVNAVSELLSAFEKPNPDSSKIAENTTNKIDSMTIGTIPFPDFDHLYASSVEETTNSNTMNLNIARSNLNAYHLDIIEEQAKIIDAQSQEIFKLKKQNEALIARIERMNRRLSLNQCSRKSSARRMSHQCRQGGSDSEALENIESGTNYVNTEKIKDEQLDDSFPDDIPLIKLTPLGKQNDISDTKSFNEESLVDGLQEPIHKQEENEPLTKEKSSSLVNIPNKESSKTNFRIKFRRNNVSLSNDHRKRNKMVRFAEENKSSQNLDVKSPKRNCAKTVDEQQLISDDAVLFLKTYPEQETTSKPVENESEEAQSAQSVKKKKSLRIPILVTPEPYFTNVREDMCQDPVTYTPTSLEVPSFRTIEKDNIESPDVPKNYYEDVRIEAAKERHLRFEIGERKRKKWDVQRIRELRQNERLKEKLRRRKSRWSKMDSPKQVKSQVPEKVTTLFPEIKSIEKIIITNAVPVTALGTSIPKVPSWGTEFETEWLNDGSIDSTIYEDNQPTNHPHHKDTKTKPA